MQLAPLDTLVWWVGSDAEGGAKNKIKGRKEKRNRHQLFQLGILAASGTGVAETTITRCLMIWTAKLEDS